MCSSTHQKFISHVKKYRQDKLKIDDKIFSGEVYNGEEAKEIGLIDGVGSMVEVLEQKYPGCKIDLEVPKSFPGSLLVWLYNLRKYVNQIIEPFPCFEYIIGTLFLR